MFIFFGIGLMGDCDRIPGIGHVATRCVYIAMMPLVPLGSFFVFDASQRRPSQPIAFSWRSYLFAWLAFFYVIGIALVLIAGAAVWAVQPPLAFALGLVGIAAAVGLWVGFARLQRASFLRALDLGKQVGVDYARLKAVYPAG